MNKKVLALAVVILLATGGFFFLGGEQPPEDDDSNDTMTNQSAELPDPLPNGVRQDSIAPEIIVQEHIEQLKATESYTIAYERNVVGGGRFSQQSRVQNNQILTTVNTSRSITTTYDDGTGQYTRQKRNAETTYSYQPSSRSIQDYAKTRLLQSLLEATRFETPTPSQEKNGRKALRLSSAGQVDVTTLERQTQFINVSSTEGYIIIDERGVIREASFRVTGDTPEGQEELLYQYYTQRLPNNVFVQEPDWTRQVQEDRLSMNAQLGANLIFLSHNKGPPLPSETQIEITSSNSTQTVTLSSTVEQTDTIYLYINDGSFEASVNQIPAENDNLPESEYTIRVSSPGVVFEETLEK